MPISAHQIVTFSAEPFGGNPAFVVTREKPLPDSVLSSLCAQLHEDVLAVMIPDEEGIELRHVTRSGPHPGAGHSTHAAAWLALNRLQPEGFITEIEADAIFGKLQVYDAWDYPYICVEPVNNANDGFNRAALDVPGHSVIVLEPGKSLAGSIKIRAEQSAKRLSS